MANSISIAATLRVSGTVTYQSPQDSDTITTTNDHYSSYAQSIGATPEALTIGADVASLGYCRMKNLDDANSIDIGTMVGSTFSPLLTIGAGEISLLRWKSNATPYAQCTGSGGAILEHVTFEL